MLLLTHWIRVEPDPAIAWLLAQEHPSAMSELVVLRAAARDYSRANVFDLTPRTLEELQKKRTSGHF